jgi:hypothetical protein
MKIKTLTFFILLLNLTVYSQNKFEKFEGVLLYQITFVDTNIAKMIPPSYMKVYTNDTVVRIENTSFNFGNQIVIKHTIFNKSYLLIDSGDKKFAIQTDRNKNIDTLNKVDYKLKRKSKTIEICGKKANLLILSNPKNNKSTKLYYYKTLSNKYIDAYNESPGLPVLFYLDSNEGLLKYELITITHQKVNRDLFGIPSNYQKTTFEEFMQQITVE